MSNNNNQIDPQITGLVIAAVIAMWAMMVVAALLAVAALVLTFFAFWAWNKPRPFFGSVIQPEDARQFVGRGLIGVLLGIPLLRLIFQWLGLPVTQDFPMYAAIAGYTFGSLIIGYGIEKLKEASAAQAPPPAAPMPPTVPEPVKLPQRPPFEYATWDDEERK